MNLFRRTQKKSDDDARPPSIYDLAKRIDDFDDVAHPSELLAGRALPRAIAMLAESAYTTAELTTFALGENETVAALAILTLARREVAEAVPFLLEQINSLAGTRVKYFALEALSQLVPAPQSLLGRVLVRMNDDWWDGYDRFLLQFLREFTRRRVAAGEAATFDGALARDDVWRVSAIGGQLDHIDKDIAAPLRAEWEAFDATRTNVGYLRTIGIVDREDELHSVVEHEALTAAAQFVEQTLTAETRRSVLIVGEEGVGKTTIVRAAAKRLRAAGWTIFEAGANEILAGQSYIGELEERLLKMMKNLRAPRRVAWIVPRFHELEQAGRTRQHDNAVLDAILPEVDAGRLTIIGEVSASAYQRLVERKRRVATALVTIRVEAASADDTLELARQWAAARQPSAPLLADDLLAEAWQLTQQFLGMRATPGNLLSLLELTHARLRAVAAEGELTITVDDLLVTLAQLTGLPNSILDDREGLDLAALREHFAARVLGQPEAVNVLTDRVAMIKAGLCDPTRPFGVFLFAGPTGTGKTEIAKALAEYLFGSAERMIRIDMSELKTFESLARLLGDGNGETQSLVDAVRRQPFSVVLLDELEKAHPNVWDLFLQVFDDGRLTDRRGVTADFRHTLIIMTSNSGAAATNVGFGESAATQQAAQISRALAQQFRRELLNRIDRIVVFRPLTRETMRGILERELGQILRRRGLRNRSWAVEWDDDAIDVLLTDGFTPDLGARPLKRAIERKLLAPLAEKIVSRDAPAGRHSLVIRAAGDDLRIDFATNQ